MRKNPPMAHAREAELVAALPPPAAEAMRKVLADPDVGKWATRTAYEDAMVAVDYPRGRFPLPEQLTPAQRAFIEITVSRPELDPVAPAPRWTVRRWLGMDPGGALERVVPHEVGGARETSPLWRELDAARNDPAELRRLIERLPMPERLAVYGELDAGAYGFTRAELDFELPGLESLRDEGREWAPRHADWLLERAKDPSNPYDVKQRLRIRPPLFLSLLRSHVPIEPRWEVFLPLRMDQPDLIRECLGSFSDERKVHAVRAALPTGMPEEAMKILVPLMDMYPLPGLVELAFERHIAFYPPKKETLAALEDAARRHPELAEALAENRKKKPLKLQVEPQPRPAQSALTPLQKKQIAQMDEGTLEHLDFYLVKDAKGAPLYDAILFADSDGQVFKTGTSEAVAMIAQQNADGQDGALCVALDQAFEAYRKKAKSKKPTKKRS
jgi:hypothetical protein